MNDRKKQAKQMLDDSCPSAQIDKTTFKVQSQTTPDKFYLVKAIENKGLVCECPDNKYRRSIVSTSKLY